MKSVIKFLWVAAYIVIIFVVGDQRALTYTDTPPSIIWMTGDQNQCVGTTVQFSVGTVNAQNYEWSKNGVDLVNGGNISGVSSATLTISNVSAADVGNYGVDVSNEHGDAWGSSHLSVTTDSPVITNQPVSVALLLGANATQVQQFQSSDGVYIGGNSASFTVAATGCQPMSYQWKKNGVNLADGGHIAGAHSTTLHINSASMADAGTYMVVVTNAAGTVSSTVVSLHVCQFVTSSQDKILGYQYSDINGGTATIHFHFGSPTTISGLNIYGNLFLDQTAQLTGTGVLLNTGSTRIPMYCQVYASAIPDPGKQIGLTSIFFSSKDKFYCPNSTPSTDYTVVLRSLSVTSSPIRNYPIVPRQNYFFPRDRLSFSILRGDILISLFQTISSTNWDCQGPTPLPSVAFTPDTGPAPLDVQLSVPGYPSAQIYYTVNGSTPTRGSTLYSGPIHLSATTTVKAFATLGGYPDGPISSLDYSTNPKLPAVSFTPISRMPGFELFWLTLPADVTMSVPGYPHAEIHYTLNGTVPTASSTLYTGPIHVTALTAIKAIAVQSGFANGPITDANYGLMVSINPHPIQLLEQSLTRTVTVGGDATFFVQVAGDQPISYQWQFNGVDLTDGGNISGSQSSSLHVTAAQLADGGAYLVKVWNWVNQVQSAVMTLTVETPKPPIITEQPGSKVVLQGDDVTFSVSVVGTAPFTYQWYHNGTAISGSAGTARTLMRANAQILDGGTYHVVIQNQAGTVTSADATLTLVPSTSVTVSIQADPGLNLTVGHSVTLSTVVQSPSPVTYQWQFNGKDLLGENKSFLYLPDAELGNSGVPYTVIVKNIAGGSSQASVQLNVSADGTLQFSHINDPPLKIPAQNGTYVLSMSTLLPPNSDAKNVKKFIVTKVDSGSLLINGESFGPDNNTIGPVDWVTWMPPVVADNPPKPAFTVYASDGTHDTSVTPGPVGVSIENKPQTRLFAWGRNEGGAVGNGYYYNVSDDNDYTGKINNQARLGLIPKDPRWKAYPDGVGMGEPHPQKVLDAPNIESVANYGGYWYDSVVAVATDGTVWQWGFDNSFLFGLPFANYYAPSPLNQTVLWQWGLPQPDPNIYPIKVPFPFISPTPRMYEAPRSDMSREPFVGVAKVTSTVIGHRIAMKKDGTLWSWGVVYDRNPKDDDDRFESNYGDYGMTPRRVEIEGNDLSGVTEGRKIVDIEGNVDSIALCKDGTVWWWPEVISPWPNGGNFGVYDLWCDNAIDLGGTSAQRHLTAIDNIKDIDTPSPIVQIAASGQHYAALRGDGRIFEFGYVPQLDPSGKVTYGYGHATDEQVIAAYSRQPIPLSGLPSGSGNKVVSIALGEGFGVALTEGGHVWVWGHFAENYGPAGWDEVPYQVPTEVDPKMLSGIVQVVAGWDYILALDKRGLVWGWGYNDGWFSTVLGNSGNYQSTFSTTPIRILGIEQVQKIFCGYDTAFAVGVEEDVNRMLLSATPGDQEVMLSWRNSPSGAAQYKVYRSTDRYDNYTLIGTVDGTEFTDNNNGSGLVNGTAYYYKVSALVSGVENGMSWEQMATPLPLPEAIPSASLHAVGECRGIQLTWSAPANATDCQLKKYRVLRSTSATGSFIAIAECASGTLQYFDNTAAVNPYYYRIIPVNDSGQPAANSTLGPVSVNPASCAPAPYIASNWRPYRWFQQASHNDPELGITATATLCWAHDPAHPWGTTPTAFRIHYRYLYHGVPFGGVYSQDVSREAAEAANVSGKASNDNGQPSSEYSFTWNTSGLVCYASVSAIVDGQEGDSSVEVGPVAISSGSDSVQWTGSLSATPGYRQVYLEWPDNENLCTYTVMRTGTRPGRTPEDSGSITWDTLSANVTMPRYWDTGLTSTLPTGAFVSSDINLNTLSTLNGSLSAQDNLVSAALYSRWTTAQHSELASGVSASRMAELLNLAMNYPVAGAEALLTDTDFQTVNSQNGGNVFTPKTKELFESRASLSSGKIYFLNRLIVEEAFSSFGFGDWVQSMHAYNYYRVEGTVCGDISSASLAWVQARQDDADVTGPDTNLHLNIDAAPYNGMVEIDWHLSESFANVVAGGTPLSVGSASVQIISANRYHGATLVATGVLDTDFHFDPLTGNITIPTGSDLVCQSGDSVLISFAPLSSDSAWQFWLERKLNTTGASYQRITDSGFGLAYLDQDVVNGQGYIYRVTATDGKFNRWQAESSAVTPETSDSLTLNAKPGNNYVDLAWPPVRATQFTVEHSLTSSGGFEVVASLPAANAYQNPPNTFRHVGAQNNKDHYYKVIATTPTGVQIESPVVSAMPLASLPPLPPTGFKATQQKDSSGRRFILTWNSQVGAGKFQVFVRENASLKLLYEGSSPRCYYTLPADFQEGAIDGVEFKFAIRSLNFSGVAGDLDEKLFTWEEDSTSSSAPEDSTQVHVKAAGQLLNTGIQEFTGPTNLALSVEVSIPNVKSVSFYDGDDLLGTTKQGSTEFLWCHVPGGGHWLSARVEVGDPNLTTGSTYAIYTTPSRTTDGDENVHVTIQPELSAFQTSVTDLQLPAPGLPITLSRSYTSRSASKDSRGLAVGWSASWLAPSVTLSSGLSGGWKGATTEFLNQVIYYIFSESNPHLIMVNLPDGETLGFQPEIKNTPVTNPGYYEDLDDRQIDMQLIGFDSAAGTLSGVSEVSIDTPADLPTTPETWAAATFAFDVTFGSYTYNAPDGTQYTFGQDANGDGLTYLLTEVKDRNGNTLTYAYDQGSSKNLLSIIHSSGRKVMFNYSTANQIWVSDSIAGTHPVLKYIFDNRDGQTGKLLEVDHLVDQTGSGTYEPTFYDYGTTTFATEPQLEHDHQITANAGRLTDIFDARRIRTLHNEYHYDTAGQTGDLFSQTDVARRITTYNLDEDNNLTVTHSWTDENGAHTRTAEVQHDESGAISSVAQPSDDSGGMQISSTLTYDERGRLIAQTDANNKSKAIGYDEKNRPTSQTDENGNSTTITPDDDHFGQPGIAEDAEHNQTIYIYDPQGNPLDIKDPSGTETTYTYLDPVTGSGYALGTRPRSERRAVAPFTIVTEYAYYGDDTAENYSSKGDIKSTTEKWVQPVNGVDQTIGTPVTTYIGYDANGNRTNEVKSHTVSSGPPAVVEYVRTENVYDAQNRMTDTQMKTISTSAGTPPTATQWSSASVTPHTHTHTTYNAIGKQASTTDGYGRTTFYLYDISGNLIETKSPDNTVTRATYDEQNRAVYVQDRAVPSSEVTVAPATKTTYDAAGRVAKVERLTNITLTKSTTTDFANNGTAPTQYKMAASSPGDVLTTTRTFYDSVGRQKYSVDVYNVTTEYTYDAGGRRVSSKVYRSNSDASYVYSGSGVPAPPANSAFVATFYTYDANGNQTSVTSGITSFDSNGHPVDGQTTTYTYDAANRCTRTTFPATGPSGPAYRSTDYDGLGRSIREVDENHVAKAFTYDFRGLLTSVTVGVGTAQAATTKYGYDELGNLVKQIDPNNHTTTFTYDALGRRVSRTLPDNKTESVTYDFTNLTLPNKTVTDFNGHETSFTFDNMDRLVSKQLPAVGDFAATTVTYDYDAAGHPADVIQSGGVNRTVRYAYDAVGRLRVKETPEGTLTYNYYDSGSVAYIGSQYIYSGWPGDGDPPARFEGLSAYGSSDPHPEWDYYYDGLGHLSQVCDDQVDGNLYYSYDVLGNLAETHYGNNITTTYTYNERNWLRRVRAWNSGSGPSSLVANFDYDQAGEGVNPTAPSNWGDRLLSPTGQRRRAVEHYGSVQRTVDYDYDALQRLTKETISGAQTAVVAYDGTGTGLGYDPVGNRQSRQLTSGSLSGVGGYTGDAFDSRDRLTRSGFSYDDNGNTTGSAGGVTDYYDAENHLIKRTQSGQPDIVMTYDADGNRVSKSVGGVATSYLIDDRNPTGYAQVLEERDEAGATIVGYMYGSSLAARFGYDPISHWLTSLYYYGYDGLGSVSYLTDFVGNLTDTYTYDAFGIQIASTGTTPNTYRYTGQQWDADLGMYYLRARYYKPDSGRFWTPDTFEGRQTAPLSLHKYLYAENDPEDHCDPSGLTIWVCTRRTVGFPMGTFPLSLFPGGSVGRHAYFWDDRANLSMLQIRSCSMQEPYKFHGDPGITSERSESGPIAAVNFIVSPISNPLVPNPLAGVRYYDPIKDVEGYPIPGSEGSEDWIMQRAHLIANAQIFDPPLFDCHSAVDRMLEDMGLPSVPHRRYNSAVEETAAKGYLGGRSVLGSYLGGKLSGIFELGPIGGLIGSYIGTHL